MQVITDMLGRQYATQEPFSDNIGSDKYVVCVYAFYDDKLKENVYLFDTYDREKDYNHGRVEMGAIPSGWRLLTEGEKLTVPVEDWAAPKESDEWKDYDEDDVKITKVELNKTYYYNSEYEGKMLITVIRKSSNLTRGDEQDTFVRKEFLSTGKYMYTNYTELYIKAVMREYNPNKHGVFIYKP